MHFALTDEQVLLRRALADFARTRAAAGLLALGPQP
jgi:hypothetical protein